MTKEYVLVILLGRIIISDIALKRIERILKGEINWFEVFRISTEERTVFLIYKNLQTFHYLWLLPNELRHIWQTAYLGNAEYNQKLLNNATEIKTYLFDNGIQVLPIRGTSLMQMCPSAMPWRITSDMDFILSPCDLDKLQRLMNNQNAYIAYIDDEDVFLEISKQKKSIFFAKIIVDIINVYLGYDLCYGLPDKDIFELLIEGLSRTDKDSEKFYLSHMFILYKSAIDSGKKYTAAGMKKYSFSRLIDIELFKMCCSEHNILISQEYLGELFHIKQEIQEIQEATNYFLKG